MKNVRFNITSMSSNPSESMIKDVIGGFTGVKSVDVSFADKTVSVNLDPTLISEKKIKEAIEVQGYDINENDIVVNEI